MTKIEQLKSGLRADIAMLLIISAIAGLSSYFLTMAWIEQELIQFIASGIFTGCFGWLALMQSLTVLHSWQKVGREQIRLDLHEAKRRFDIKF